MRRQHPLALWATLFLFTLCGVEELRAEEGTPESGNDTDRARSLFIEGVEFADASEWQQAAQRFEAALQLHDAPTIRFNLGSMYSHLERWIEAAEQLDHVLGDPECPDDLRSQAEVILSAVESHLARVVLSIEGIEPGTRVSLDAREIEEAERQNPIRVEPGAHVVTASLDGTEVLRRSIDVAAGETLEVSERIEHPVETAITEPPPPVEPEPAEDRPLIRDWRLWLGVGVGAAVVITAIAVGVAVGTRDRVEDPVQGNMDPPILEWP